MLVTLETKMKPIKFSIITPSYNASSHLVRMIDSVRRQTGNFAIEHIIVDNCSTDGSSEILKKYVLNSDAIQVRLIIEPDAGQSNAINKGFKAATGDIICWLNADETYEPNALATVADAVTSHIDADLFFGDFVFTGHGYEHTKTRRAFGFSRMMLLYYGCYIPSCATFFRKRIIDSGHLLDESYRVTMDFEYYLRLDSLGYRFVHLPVVLATFSLRSDNVSVVQYERRRIERFRAQSAYSKIQGSPFVRRYVFRGLEFYWIAVRVSFRIMRSLYARVNFLSGLK
jgi:glycosyltransferase involved in cell wall biosynthesis